MKLSHKILAATLFPFLGIIGFYHLLSTNSFSQYLTTIYQQQATHQLARAEEDIRAFLLASEYQLRLLATINPPDQQKTTATRMAMGGLLQNVESFFRISAINANGKEWLRLNKFPTSNDNPLRNNFFTSPLYQRPMLELAPYFGNIRRSPDFPLPFIDISVPVKNRKTGKVNGVLAAQISFQPIQAILERYLPPDGKIILAQTDDSNILAVADDSKTDYSALEKRVLARVTQASTNHGFMEEAGQGERATFLYNRFTVNDVGFLLLYYQPYKTVYYLTDRLARFNLQIIIGGVVLFCLASAILIRVIITPLSKVTDQISHLGSEYSRDDNGSVSPPDDTLNEVDRLRLAFRNLADRLAVHRQESENFKQTLEQEVQEKTRELDEANMALTRANEELLHDMEHREQMEKEKEKLNLQLQQAQKMEAVGTLAGGVAHDFNNILSAILGYAELAKLKAPDQAEVDRCLGEVLQAGNRAKELVKQILTFSRQTEVERRPLAVGSVIKEALKLLRASIPTTIEIRENISPDCGMALADPIKIHQVLMNLCTNAYHAMRETGGILAVELTRMVVDPEDQKVTALHLTPGPYLRLQVSDTGHGMDRATLERIFDPYFTTKKKGEGTGMGLAVVHGIVTSHGGHISVYSEPGRGACFHVYLPEIERQQMLKEEQTVTVRGGNEHLLLVDDEDSIIEIERNILEDLGYRVTSSTSSLEALEIFRSQPGEIDLVITDMTMPRMTGLELSQNLMSLRPDLPIIICTGFSELLNEETAQDMGIRQYMMKPVSRRDLARIVRNVLDQGERE